MAYFIFFQNNSGGSFNSCRLDSDLSFINFIEAASPEDADERAMELGCYFDGVNDGRDCPCCGDRWSRADDEIDLGSKSIEEYATEMNKDFSWDNMPVKIFKMNGEIKII